MSRHPPSEEFSTLSCVSLGLGIFVPFSLPADTVVELGLRGEATLVFPGEHDVTLVESDSPLTGSGGGVVRAKVRRGRVLSFAELEVGAQFDDYGLRMNVDPPLPMTTYAKLLATRALGLDTGGAPSSIGKRVAGASHCRVLSRASLDAEARLLGGSAAPPWVEPSGLGL